MSVENADSIGKPEAAGFAPLNTSRTVVLIPGMHRSGTSAVARVLNLLGCDISHNLLEANEFNERGYWEDPYFLDLNERMFQSAGLAWNSWESVSDDWYASAKPAQFRKEAISLVKEKFGDSSLFVIKDPRIARLLPFWRGVFEEMGIAVKAVVPLRKPAEVAASLQKRDRLNFHQAQLIWLRYNLDAEYGSRGLDRAFVTYDQLLDDWQAVTTSIKEGFGDFTWPRQSVSAYAEIDAFLSADLRHHQEKRKNAMDESPWAREVWTVLSRWAQTGIKKSDAAKLDAIRNTLAQAERNFARVLLDHQRYGEYIGDALNTAKEALDKQVEAAEAAAMAREAEFDAESSALKDEMEAVGLRLSEAESELETARSLMAGLEARLSETQTELYTANAYRVGLEARVGELEAGRSVLSDHEETVARLQAQVDEMDGLRAAMAVLEGQLADADGRVSAALAEVDGERLAAAEFTARIAELEAEGRQGADQAELLGEISAELITLKSDALSDADEMKRLSLLIEDQEGQIARLKVWLASSQKNSEYYQSVAAGGGLADDGPVTEGATRVNGRTPA
ncbi:hypothetical protein [Brevundimonas sp.]